VSPRAFASLLIACAAAASLAAAPASACDSSSCLLMTRGQNGLLGKGDVRVDVSFRHTPMTALLQGSDTVGRVLRPKIDFEHDRLLPGFHDELGGSDTFLQLDVAYGLSGRAALFASMPVFAHRAFDIGHAPILRETYSTSGNGDALLGVRYGLFQRPQESLVGSLSLEVPAGRHTLKAPSGFADTGILDPMLQPGSGAVDLGGTLQYARRVAGSWDTTAAATYTLYTTNDLHYHAGADAIATFTVSHALFGPLAASLQVKGVHKGRSDFMDAPVPNTGGRTLYVTPGISVRGPRQVALYGYVVVPAYRFVNEAQLAPRTGLVVGLSRTF
jgi:hypothetical protein